MGLTMSNLLQGDPLVNDKIVLTKELLGENMPYVQESVIDGTSKGKAYIFNQHFIDTTVEALSTGCIAKMSTEEEDAFFNYLIYATAQGTPENIADTKDKDVSIALNEWLTNMLYCLPNKQMNECFDATFKYETCTQ